MKHKMFCVLDAKVKAFGKPFFEETEESAIRVFSDAVNDGSNPHNMWYKHPEDYSLHYIGEFDAVSGELLPVDRRSLVNAVALMAFRNGSESKVEVVQ